MTSVCSSVSNKMHLLIILRSLNTNTNCVAYLIPYKYSILILKLVTGFIEFELNYIPHASK